ncbi:MAG: glutamate 5-kinase [bacterium]|nr:glutamate 5-kinase [bacterium]
MSESPSASARPDVAAARRVVLKLGTRVLTHENGTLALARLFAVVEAAAELRRSGREVLLVSSGAVGLGKEALRLGRMPEELNERQACAAVGQTRLMGLYDGGFSRLGLLCGQVLLSPGDFDDRVRYLNLRSTLSALLRRGVVPVINENDAVSTEELAYVEGEGRPIFGDNDRLSALVATKLDADLLVLLTDVEGLFDRDPKRHDGARLLARVDDPDEPAAAAGGRGSEVGRGGMRSKVEAAAVAARGGCHAVIASGLEPGVLGRVLAGDDLGSWFPAKRALGARRRWIAHAVAPRGALELDAGAVEALRRRGASLLAAGVVRIEGDFEEGDVVELRGPGDSAVGRGIVFCDAATARDWCGGRPPDGVRNHHALVHRDHLALEI